MRPLSGRWTPDRTRSLIQRAQTGQLCTIICDGGKSKVYSLGMSLSGSDIMLEFQKRFSSGVPMRQIHIYPSLILCALALLLSAAAFGQVVGATLTGPVSDPTGPAIPKPT